MIKPSKTGAAINHPFPHFDGGFGVLFNAQILGNILLKEALDYKYASHI